MTQINAGLCLKRAMAMRGISCQKMAEDWGLMRQQITRWRGNKDMSLGKLQRFAKYFDIEFFEFLKLGEE